MNINNNGFYAHPLYYDILFGWNRAPEVIFYDSLFQKYGLNIGEHILEVACGTGIVGMDLARLGWDVTGLDISGAMIEFLKSKLAQNKLKMTAVKADMVDFYLTKKCRGAICPLGSFGLLNDDNLTIMHLKTMAKNMTKNGIYIIDVGLQEEVNDVSAKCDYTAIEWSMSRDNIEVDARDAKVFIDDNGVKKILEWEAVPTEFNCQHLSSLIKNSNVFEILDWYPETSYTEEGISLFDMGETQNPPIAERAMIVLRKL